MWGLQLPVWEQLMLWSLGLAAIAALAVVVTTFAVVRLQRAENEEARSELERYQLEASRRIAEANSAGELARAEAAKANLELAKIKAPRSLGDEEQFAIANAVRLFALQSFRITTFWDEQEPLTFSNQLARALQRGGWRLLPHGDGGSFLIGALTGIQVWAHPNAPQAVTAATALVAALNAVEARAVLKLQNAVNPTTDVIDMNVGTKP